MVEQISLSQQVKQNLIFNNKLVYTSCLTSCRTTLDLGPLENRKNQEKLKTSKNYCVALSPFHEMKILSVLIKIS